MVQKLGGTKRFPKVDKINTKVDILTFQEGEIAHGVNKTQRSLEITPWQGEL